MGHHVKIASFLNEALKYPEKYDLQARKALEERVQKMSGTEILNLPQKNKELQARLYFTAALFQVAFDRMTYGEQKMFYAKTYNTVKEGIRTIMEKQLRDRSRQQE